MTWERSGLVVESMRWLEVERDRGRDRLQISIKGSRESVIRGSIFFFPAADECPHHSLNVNCVIVAPTFPFFPVNAPLLSKILITTGGIINVGTFVNILLAADCATACCPAVGERPITSLVVVVGSDGDGCNR
jgi:hypothetical protein